MSRRLVMDIVERAGWTFAQTFLSLFVFSGALSADLASAKVAAFAGIAAAISVLKGVVATQVGNSNAGLPG